MCTNCGCGYLTLVDDSGVVTESIPGTNIIGKITFSSNYISNSGWICPKCQRVYGPSQYECYSCNSQVDVTCKCESNEKDIQEDK